MGLFGESTTSLERKVAQCLEKAHACEQAYHDTGKSVYQREAAAYYQLAEEARRKVVQQRIYDDDD